MKDHQIISIGKIVFGLCFLLGNMVFTGYFISKSDWFIEFGILVFFYGVLANLFAVTGLLLYGFTYSLKMTVCLKAIGLILFNIPLGFLYVILGINLIFK